MLMVKHKYGGKHLVPYQNFGKMLPKYKYLINVDGVAASWRGSSDGTSSGRARNLAEFAVGGLGVWLVVLYFGLRSGQQTYTPLDHALQHSQTRHKVLHHKPR